MRGREFVRVAGPDAEDYLQRMVSNDVEALAAGEACPALLLTAKARVIAPLVVLRRADDDFLLLTEPGLGEVVRAQLSRMRLRAECEIEPEEYESVLLFGGGEGFTTDWPGAREALDAELEPTLSEDELELRRIESGVPRWEREIDDRILPAEAGLDSTHVSFSKGCYPGQEPVARLHFRGHPNRQLRVLELAMLLEDGLPERDAPLLHDGKEVGRVTSAARREDGTVVALAYVRTEVPDDAPLALAARAG
jgi:folate-binding protein YgfZ